ncbi:AzlC family ABC transporter permease [Liquorilactobacillus hordei]|uniref:Branched-chain amino acid transporter AzlC n=1 Tax=Liquorilactobacillus hordei TaxID=468911 RepID=A0A3S6QQN4_9LACO|nr:AzlC family ABC transporter permease [Liquorilactobacillus hordei]AUJ30370.1 branched-chain amino acid transporter AzlC [Liquorilactobacillus hordei]
MNNQLTRKRAIIETLPTVLGYIGIGITVGIVGRAAGLNVLEVVLMSMITYGGSVQFVIIGMIINHSELLPILLATFLVNARMILISMSVAPYLEQESVFKNILLGSLLTDETYVLSMNKINYTKKRLNFEWLNISNLIAYFTWAIASFTGALVGNYVETPQKFGLDFALIAMFIGLLYLQIISEKEIKIGLQVLVIMFTLFIMYFGLVFVSANILVLLVTILSCLFGVIMKNVFF